MRCSSGFVVFVLPPVIAALALACGGQAKTPTKPAADAGAPTDAAVATFTPSPPPSGLPPLAPMPPPGVAGSKKAKVKNDAALGPCSGPFRAQAKDPAGDVKRHGEACAAASKSKALGAPMRGSQADRDPAFAGRFHADANHCYRVYVAGDESAKDVTVVLRDSAGDVILESPAPVAPAGGAVCFSAADDVSVLVGVGSGKGEWVAQVWGD
jgi:hypothetical protein